MDIDSWVASSTRSPLASDRIWSVDKLKLWCRLQSAPIIAGTTCCRVVDAVLLIRTHWSDQLNSPSTYNINPPPGTSECVTSSHRNPSMINIHQLPRICIKCRSHLFQSLVSVPPNSAMLEASSTKHRRQRHLKPRERCKCSRSWSTSRFRNPATGVSCHMVSRELQLFYNSEMYEVQSVCVGWLQMYKDLFSKIFVPVDIMFSNHLKTMTWFSWQVHMIGVPINGPLWATQLHPKLWPSRS